MNITNNLVSKVFSTVANKYDLMNDVMSFGIHRLWKRIAIEYCSLKAGHIILDLAGGSGDLTKLISPIIAPNGKVVLTDYNSDMLRVASEKLINLGVFNNVSFVQADAQQLPFRDNSFDRIVIGFGLRNIPDKLQALKRMYMALKPGGRVIILEFSRVTNKQLGKIYRFYSKNIIPRLGEFICNDRFSYQYLVDSIKTNPNQETILSIMQQANFEDCNYKNLNFGVVAIHVGHKY